MPADLTLYNNDKVESLHSPALDLLGAKPKVLYWKFIQSQISAMLPI